MPKLKVQIEIEPRSARVCGACPRLDEWNETCGAFGDDSELDSRNIGDPDEDEREFLRLPACIEAERRARLAAEKGASE